MDTKIVLFELINERLKLYKDLLEITKEQTDILKNNCDLELYNKSNKKRDDIEKEIETIQKNLGHLLINNGISNLNEIKDQRLSEIIVESKRHLHEIEKYQEKILSLLKEQYKQITVDISHVQKHKTVLHSYYGMNKKETTAIYFDQKK